MKYLDFEFIVIIIECFGMVECFGSIFLMLLKLMCFVFCLNIDDVGKIYDCVVFFRVVK